MIPAPYQRLVSRGDLPHSDGGIYNPGAFTIDGYTFLACRRERDYTWTQPAYVEVVEFRASDYAVQLHPTRTCTVLGHDTDARIEDARPFVWQDRILVAHTLWKPHDRSYPIRPRLSRWDARGGCPVITRDDDWHLPLVCQPVEKNWVLLEREGELYTVYCLDPLVIFRRHRAQGTVARPDGWVLYNSAPNGWEKALGKPPRNSTHLLPFAGGYLGWWHIILDQTYVHGAYWLDQQLHLRARTGVLFDGSWVGRADPASVYKPGVLYVSSQLIQDEQILLFCGEGDAHSGVVTLKTDDILEALHLRP